MFSVYMPCTDVPSDSIVVALLLREWPWQDTLRPIEVVFLVKNKYKRPPARCDDVRRKPCIRLDIKKRLVTMLPRSQEKLHEPKEGGQLTMALIRLTSGRNQAARQET